jgi:hypothetical protein
MAHKCGYCGGWLDAGPFNMERRCECGSSQDGGPGALDVVRIGLQILSIANVFGAVKNIVTDAAADPTLFRDDTWSFKIDVTAATRRGKAPADVVQLLRAGGVTPRAGFVLGDTYSFSVPLKQKEKAERIMQRANVPWR